MMALRVVAKFSSLKKEGALQEILDIHSTLPNRGSPRYLVLLPTMELSIVLYKLLQADGKYENLPPKIVVRLP